jgi:hypothetical protein
MRPVYLGLYSCPAHGTYMVAIDDTDGIGIRITSECCGNWRIVHRWKVSVETMREAFEHAQNVSEATQ